MLTLLNIYLHGTKQLESRKFMEQNHLNSEVESGYTYILQPLSFVVICNATNRIKNVFKFQNATHKNCPTPFGKLCPYIKDLDSKLSEPIPVKILWICLTVFLHLKTSLTAKGIPFSFSKETNVSIRCLSDMFICKLIGCIKI